MASAQAAASRTQGTTLRLAELRARLERLQRGEPCTGDDVESAKHWADAQAHSLEVAMQRLAAVRDRKSATAAHRPPAGLKPPTAVALPTDPSADSTSAARELSALRKGLASLLAWPSWLAPDHGAQRRQWCEAVVAWTGSPQFRGWADAVCRTAVAVFPQVTSAAICAVAGSSAEVTAATDEHTHALQELELIVGEGPTTTARRNGAITVVPDLGADGSWQGYASASSGHDVHAVTAAPLLVQGTCIGSLTLYGRPQAGSALVGLEDARAFAEIAAAGLRADLGNASLEDAASSDQFSFYVATGATAARLDITTEEAECRLRAHAFAAGMSLAQVAHEVLAGHIDLS